MNVQGSRKATKICDKATKLRRELTIELWFCATTHNGCWIERSRRLNARAKIRPKHKAEGQP